MSDIMTNFTAADMPGGTKQDAPAKKVTPAKKPTPAPKPVVEEVPVVEVVTEAVAEEVVAEPTTEEADK